jgi:hypothetical protein
MRPGDDMDETLRAELLARHDEDQRIRHLAAQAATAGGRLPHEIGQEWSRIDQGNTAWLAELTRQHGWPGRSQVGDDGAQAAWLLAQHADHTADQQREFLGLLREAVAAGEASAAHLAYLEDRVRVHAGQPQLYGTQFTQDADGLRPEPIEDREHLEERRAAAGLGPFAEYEARMHGHQAQEP